MSGDEGADELEDAQWIRGVAPPQTDPVAELLRANVRRRVLAIDVTPPVLGRFTILEVVGRGAMGTVFAAYDPTLDRKVALKLLQGTDDREVARQKILEEARALAKLTHPNVVSVYEAEEAPQGLYIAMEFVTGPNLRAWLEPPEHGWQRVIGTMVDAGRGLAAAHRAGVFHGDFKPENVLVGDDRVRVVDFGLARIDSQADPMHAQDAVAGTPRYMAPERLDGGPPTAAADQFAFCVALYEAMYQARPFAAASLADLRARLRDPPSRPARRADVPAWIFEVIEIGLARDPKARHPSMDAVVDRLLRAGARRRRWGVLVGTTAVGLGGAGLWFGERTPPDPCAGGREDMAEVWNEGRLETLHRALRTSAGPLASSLVIRVDRGIAEFADQWVDSHREVCEASRVRGDQSDSLYDARMRCLKRRLQSFQSVLETMESADGADAALDAGDAVSELDPPRGCTDVSAADAAYVEAPDAGLAGAIEEVRARLDRAQALYDASQYGAALAEAGAADERATELEFVALQAEARALHGVVESRAGESGRAEALLREAQALAAEVGDDRLRATIMIDLLRGLMFRARFAEVEALETFVRADAIRGGLDANEVDGIVGEALLQKGEASAAKAALERALQTERRSGRIAILQTTLGNAELQLGHVDAALALYQAALDSRVTELGPDHPRVAFFLDRLARALHSSGDLDGARSYLERALALRTRSLAADDRAVATTLAGLAAVKLAQGDLDAAERDYERALAIRTAVYGSASGRIVPLVEGLGDLAAARGDDAAALERYQTALDVQRHAAPDHPQVVGLLARIARVQRNMRDSVGMRATLRAARAAATALPPDHPVVQELAELGATD